MVLDDYWPEFMDMCEKCPDLETRKTLNRFAIAMACGGSKEMRKAVNQVLGPPKFESADDVMEWMKTQKAGGAR